MDNKTIRAPWRQRDEAKNSVRQGVPHIRHTVSHEEWRRLQSEQDKDGTDQLLDQLKNNPEALSIKDIMEISDRFVSAIEAGDNDLMSIYTYACVRAFASYWFYHDIRLCNKKGGKVKWAKTIADTVKQEHIFSEALFAALRKIPEYKSTKECDSPVRYIDGIVKTTIVHVIDRSLNSEASDDTTKYIADGSDSDDNKEADRLIEHLDQNDGYDEWKWRLLQWFRSQPKITEQTIAHALSEALYYWQGDYGVARVVSEVIAVLDEAKPSKRASYRALSIINALPCGLKEDFLSKIPFPHKLRSTLERVGRNRHLANAIVAANITCEARHGGGKSQKKVK